MCPKLALGFLCAIIIGPKLTLYKMKVNYENSIEHKALKLIDKSPSSVLLRKDFAQLGGYRQVSRALNKLIAQKRLVKIGFGVYAKAHPSEYIDEPVIEDGFDNAVREALDRMDIQWEPGSAEQAYNNDESQQIPTQNIVRLKTRLRRKLSYGNRQLYFEGQVNAR
tara:strand:+ start:85614 stop:86111 length:498 start_codon:yes stop_codon:yes gene_type:complete